MSELQLTLNCPLYDRMLPLYTGEVKPEGIKLMFQPAEFWHDFARMSRDKVDVAERSGTEIVMWLDAGGSPYVAIPVWASRVFRHSFIFVNRRAGIRTAKGLEGKRIGVPLFTMSAAVWIRGLLAEDYDVDFDGVEWIQGAMERAGAHNAPELPIAVKNSRLTQNRSGKSLWQLLVAGEIDALFAPSVPSQFGTIPEVVRLFENHVDVEKEYFRRTGIFPIMHIIAIRREVFESHRFIAKALYDAFERAKRLAYSAIEEVGAYRVMLPLLPFYWEETKRLFGNDPWPYGVEANRPTLEALLRYLRRDGLISQRLTADDLFVSV